MCCSVVPILFGWFFEGSIPTRTCFHSENFFVTCSMMWPEDMGSYLSYILILHKHSRIQTCSAPNLYGMSPTIWMLSESTQNMHHFGASATTTVFFVEEIQAIQFSPVFTSFTTIVNFEAGLLQICIGCHQQYGDHPKVHGKGLHFGASSVTIA